MNRQNIWKYLLILGIVFTIFGKQIQRYLIEFSNSKTKSPYSQSHPHFVCKRSKPTHIEQKRENIWLVAIDGSNQFANRKNGHNTKIQLKPEEKVEVEFIGGRISYYDRDTKSYVYYDYPWQNRNYDLVRKYLGENVRYEIKNAGNNVLIVLRTKNSREKIYKIASSKTVIKNPFNEPATIFLFYNGKEYNLKQNGELEETFWWNGCDGSKMYFGIYKIKPSTSK